MENEIKKELELIFKESNSSDELFDAFRKALDAKIKDADLYKTLLWNRALSSDEISMYAEKICQEYPEFSFSIYFWVGKIFSSISTYGSHHEKAFEYFNKASSIDRTSCEPFLAVAKLYSKELNIPRIEKVVQIFKDGLESVKKKSELCFSLSKLFKRIGNIEKEKEYQKLGEQFQKEGS